MVSYDPSCHVLAATEQRLRSLLPADLYAAAWVDPSSKTLMRVFEHLRTLQRILIDYLPRDVVDYPPQPGMPRHEWQAGTLLFTDLAGFTPLLAARAAEGIAGAELLLKLLNQYFASMIEIVGKSGGNLLEFTGDALLVLFPSTEGEQDIAQAIHAGLRMQRAMDPFREILTLQGPLSLQMRVGLHRGRFVKADVGSPHRMSHVLLGGAVTAAKQAEGAGKVGQVCITATLQKQMGSELSARLQVVPQGDRYGLIVDDFTPEELGEYEITLARRRSPSPMVFDRSVPALVHEVEATVALVEPLASYLPQSVLRLLVDTASDRKIPPAFPSIAVAFVNLIGLPEGVDEALPEELAPLVHCFSSAFARINGVVELRGGILQKVTYHSIGSEMLIHFGVLNPDDRDARRAATAALAIRELVQSLAQPRVRGNPVRLTCRIGLAYGPVFAAEVGERRGRREFNVLGDTVNLAARLMSRAGEDEIWISEAVHHEVHQDFMTRALGDVALKGKQPQPVYTLLGPRRP